ncbi:hypothetical protein [Granulicella sp. dw_53]|uniref:hypothetical protein n=1 Tax=Granulicella sp. dw_53 TaxID=2719792 RepID=UPI001BD350DB|nr:hypothetical protein [Granulicella sp. dw_53]
MVSTKTEELANPGDVTTDSRRALVSRVVGSSVFAKSERLSTFLSLVCELALTGRASEINEQKIGSMLFGRAADFDSSVDGIVRTQASRLRQRLDLYFNGEGANEPVRIVLPRGTYVPLFERRLPIEAAASALPISEPVQESFVERGFLDTKKTGVRISLAWVLVVVLSIAVLILLFKVRSPMSREASAQVPDHPLWSVLFRPEQRTMIVPGDSGLVMWQGLTQKKTGVAEYLNGSYRVEAPATQTVEQRSVVDLASRRYTSIVDLDIATAFARIADARKSTFELRYARDVRPNDMKDGNVVLIGASAANPWVELFEPNMNFVFSDPMIRRYTVLNRKPVGGEPSRWDSNYDDAQHRVYGVVAFLPNLGGKGNVLILEGTSMAGTECAWDFVADDSSLLPLLNRIRRADGSIPHFQLVLGSSNMNGSSGKSSVLAWRVTD